MHDPTKPFEQVLTDPASLALRTFSQYLCLNEFGFTAMICDRFPSSYVIDLFQFWLTLPGTDPFTHGPILVFKWSIQCHIRRFFGDFSSPKNPLGSIFESSVPDFKPAALKGLHELYRLTVVPFRESMRKRNQQFVSSVCRCREADPFDIGFVISFFGDRMDWIDFRGLFWKRFFDFRDIAKFFEGLLMMREMAVLARANDYGKELVLFPEDLPLALFHMAESKGCHFVDINFVSSAFPSFGIVRFLRNIDSMEEVVEIEAEVRKLPDHPIVRRFRAQVELCSVLAGKPMWHRLRMFSLPWILFDGPSDEAAIPGILERWPRETAFVDISSNDWANDHDFLSGYLALRDFLSRDPCVHPTVIPKHVIVDCFSILFLPAGREPEEPVRPAERQYRFTFSELLEKLNVLRKHCPIDHPVRKFIDVVSERCSIVSELCDSPTLVDVLQQTPALFRGVLCDSRKANLFLVKGFQLPVFARSALFQTLLLGERPPGTVTPSDLERHLMEVPESQQLICHLDFLSSYRSVFSIPTDGIPQIFERFSIRRARPPPVDPDTSLIDDSLPISRFLEVVSDTWRRISNGRAKAFLQHISRYVTWGTRLGLKGVSAGQILAIDMVTITGRCIAASESMAAAATYLSQINLDLEEMVFEHYSRFQLPEPLMMELTTMFPQAMFLDPKSGAQERLAAKSPVLRKWLSRKSAPTSIAESIAAFVRDKGLFRLNSRHIEESGSFPLLIDCLLNQRELSPEDCAAFEDCLFFFDITGSWSSIAELCKKMQGQFGVPMIDIFTALCPLGQHEHLTLFELSPRERSNLAKIAFVKESDFTVVLSNPAILPSLITDRKKFVLTNPAIVARLCNLHLRAFGRNPDIQKVLVCAKIQLFLGKPSCDVIADDVLSGEPENAIRRIVKRFSLQTAISVCQSVQPIDCRAFVSENLPERIEYIRLIQDPIILEELVVDVLSRMEIRQSSHRKKWSTILARVRPFVTHGQKSGLMHHLASELLSCSFDEPFDLRALRNIPLLADRYGLFGVHAVLRDLGVGSVPQICPHFTVIPSDEVGDLRPLGRAPTIADLNLDMGSILHDFAARDKSIVPVFVISHASKQTKVFKNAPKVPISRNVVFLNVVDRDPDELFTQAIALDCVRDLCDAYVNEDATHIIFSFFCKAVSRFLWHLSGVIAHWMEGRRHLLFERFPDDNDRYKFIRRLVKLFKSAPTLERRGIPRAVILPSEYILTGTVEDLRTVRMLHRIQQATDVSIFEPQSFSILMRQGKFELAFRIARARRVDITSTFFQYASREPDLCQVILKIIPYLTDSQLETVIQSVAPILEMTTSKEGIDEFMKQLISTISDESRVFHILMWFERMEEALFYAVFRKLRPCVTELWEKIRFRTDNALVSPCRRLLRLYRIPFEDTAVT